MNGDKELWEREWGGILFHSSATNHSMGQIILIRKGFPFDVQCVHRNNRILTVRIAFSDNDVYVTNVYAPTVPGEKIMFINSLHNHINSLDSMNQIVCGDFNCVLSNDLDIVSGDSHNQREIRALNSFVSQSELNDTWRLFNANMKEYTWSRKHPFIARRLDFVFSSDSVFNRIHECSVHSVPQSDHRLVSMVYNLANIQRGPSYWKFNESLLHDQTFVAQLNQLLDDYQTNNMELDYQLKWDLCKIKVKEFCIQYSMSKRRSMRNRHIELQTDLDGTERALATDPNNKELLHHRESVKLAMEVYSVSEAKGAQTRARVKFIEEGEKNTKYFLNLEKAQANAKVMDRLKKENGEIATDQDILREQVQFYRERYRKTTDFQDEVANDFLGNTEVPQLSEEQKHSINGVLSEHEICSALKQLKKGSAPGSDGITVGCLVFFWCKIKHMVLSSLNNAFAQGEMSMTQKRAVITLIHKGKDLPRDDLNNWRPISLTNSDYKLLAKCLAIRLSSVILHIINEDQFGFLKGRNVNTAIRLIDDTIDYLNITRKPGILLALDYKAAFDTISKEFIVWSFKRFNFGDKFIKWVEVLMKNTESCISYMGWLTESFSVKSGIRQGCPFSPMAFILALELLALRIRSDPSVKGIPLPTQPRNRQNHVLKLLLYADDITFFLKDRHDLKNALTLVTYFSKFSGLAMNRNKTEAMWLGSQKYCKEKYYDLKWKLRIKILGIHFCNTLPASEIEENWLPRMETIQRIIVTWSKRNLSIMGKICIVKSLLLSQYIYSMQSLNAPEDNILKKINTMLFRFIWRKKVFKYKGR